ncbi:uncharacterized protein LOC144143271 [Haemaphysalis longicornis]
MGCCGAEPEVSTKPEEESGVSEHGPSFQPSIAVPRLTGYDDRKTVADFLSDLNVYKTASGASDEFVLTRVLPVALEASAGRWWRLQTPFASWADFEARFREEFLPPNYDYRIRRELEARTQHPREGLLEYIRAIQELFKRAIPGASDAEMVKHVLRRCHPRFRPFLHGRDYSSLEEMARSARAIEDALISELSYVPPPPVGEALEPACAWRDTYETSPQRSPQPRTAAAGLNSPRARGPSAIGDRQLERGRSLDGAAHGGNSPQRLEPGFLRWENRPSLLAGSPLPDPSLSLGGRQRNPLNSRGPSRPVVETGGEQSEMSGMSEVYIVPEYAGEQSEMSEMSEMYMVQDSAGGCKTSSTQSLASGSSGDVSSPTSTSQGGYASTSG